MTIEPHHAVTVRTVRVMPPKPEAKIRVPLSEAYLAALMAGESRLVRARYSRAFGSSCPLQICNDANRQRKADADKARAEMAARITNLLAERAVPLRSKEIQDAMGASQNHIRNVLNEMLAAGRVIKGRASGSSAWVLA